MYKRNIKPLDEHCKCIVHNPEVGLRSVILREPSVVDEFYMESVVNDDGSESVSFKDPIYVMFNQQRLNDMGTTAAKAFLDSLQPSSDSLAELRSKCSDSDLMSMVKSRHLQSPAEVLAWCRYMQKNIDIFNSEVQKLIEAQTAPTTEPVTNESKIE